MQLYKKGQSNWSILFRNFNLGKDSFMCFYNFLPFSLELQLLQIVSFQSLLLLNPQP